jgi:ABC-type lipoprotein export system ATPase subunit
VSEEDGAAVAAEDLVKYFKMGPATVKAVDHVTFRLPRGKMTALSGPSGCGKTTLLNLIGALDKPTSGRITVEEVDVGGLNGRREVDYRRHRVGFVFQAFNLLPQLSAIENVTLPMELAGKSQRHTAASYLLKRVGIDYDRHRHHPSKLSGGEQQRVSIARALANDPWVILADEPTGNLDAQTGRLIVDLLQELGREGRTVVVATHDASIADRADMVLEMLDGRLVERSES